MESSTTSQTKYKNGNPYSDILVVCADNDHVVATREALSRLLSVYCVTPGMSIHGRRYRRIIVLDRFIDRNDVNVIRWLRDLPNYLMNKNDGIHYI